MLSKDNINNNRDLNQDAFHLPKLVTLAWMGDEISRGQI